MSKPERRRRTPRPAGRRLPLLDDCCTPLVEEPLAPGQAEALAAMFKALGDPVRLRLVSLIASHAGGEVCVCDLTDRFDVTGPTISHHLKVLREVGLVDGERRGTWVYYRLVPGTLGRLAAVLGEAGAASALA
jgi:ArsR family transcriptional regulator, arsenate/arsenite/antimonite-responsive transcriptional repressor